MSQDWDLALVQEARVHPYASVLGDFRRMGIATLLGPLDEKRKAPVCALVRKGDATCVDGDSAHPRAMHLRWSPGTGQPWHFTNIYGPVPTGATDIMLTSTLIREGLSLAAARGNAPAAIVGDMNLDVFSLPVGPTIVASGFADISSEGTCASAN